MSKMQTHDLTVGHLNVYHLENKVTDVNVFLDQTRICHIFGITESRLSPAVDDDVIAIPNYSLFRRDATHSGHTGIAVYVHDTMKAFTNRRFDLESVNVESIWLEVKVAKCPVILGFIYRNPSSNFGWYDDFVIMMDKVQDFARGRDIIILGDFNIDFQKPHPAWDSTISLFNLHQVIQSATRVTSSSSTLIDHIYVNNPDRVVSAQVHQTSISDHFAIQCTVACKIPTARTRTHSTITYRSYKHFNEVDFLHDLSECSFKEIYESNDPDEAVAAFHRIFLSVYDKHAPVRRKRVGNSSTPPWFTVIISIAIKIRDKLKKEKNYSAFKQQRKHVKFLVRQAKKTYFNRITTSESDNTSSIWKALNALTNKSFPGKSLKYDCFTATDFNNHFLSIAESLTNRLKQNSDQYECPVSLKSFCSDRLSQQDTFHIPQLTVYEVGKYISNLGQKNTHGCDGLSNKILLLSLPYTVHHLTYIYNLSISKSVFPTMFKTAKIIPLPKVKNPSDLNDYRPISILSSLSKPLEKHVHKHLLQYLDRHNLLHQNQSGFRPKHSCQTALTSLLDKLLTAINDKKINGIVFLDLKKAFDLVNHRILLEKLRVYQLDTNSVNFFESYLKERKQSVLVNGTFSNVGITKMGIPQGSVLGPLLFNLYINDLPLCISSSAISCDMFADDSSLHTYGVNSEHINDRLQTSLTEVSNWCTENNMLLNPEKTKSMIVATRQKHQRGLNPLTLSIDGQAIEQVTEHRHLGVVIDNQLKWEAHISSLSRSVAKNVYLLSRLKHVVSPEASYFFFHSHIMSRINYVSNVWDNCSEVHMKKLDSVHRRAVKHLNGVLRNTRSHQYQLPAPLPLTKHLILNKCVLMHKIIFGKCPTYLHQTIVCYETRNPNSRNATLTLPKPRIDLYKSSLAYSGTHCWNNLPKHLKEPFSTTTFKEKLGQYMRAESQTENLV